MQVVEDTPKQTERRASLSDEGPEIEREREHTHSIAFDEARHSGTDSLDDTRPVHIGDEWVRRRE